MSWSHTQGAVPRTRRPHFHREPTGPPRKGLAPALSATPEGSAVESRQDLAVVSAAMAELPEDLRAPVALVCIDGLSYKQAAEITGVPIGTVMSRLARARRELHARLHAPVTARGA